MSRQDKENNWRSQPESAMAGRTVAAKATAVAKARSGQFAAVNDIHVGEMSPRSAVTQSGADPVKQQQSNPLDLSAAAAVARRSSVDGQRWTSTVRSRVYTNETSLEDIIRYHPVPVLG
jgi:hypothetical protein